MQVTRRVRAVRPAEHPLLGRGYGVGGRRAVVLTGRLSVKEPALAGGPRGVRGGAAAGDGVCGAGAGGGARGGLRRRRRRLRLVASTGLPAGRGHGAGAGAGGGSRSRAGGRRALSVLAGRKKLPEDALDAACARAC